MSEIALNFTISLDLFELVTFGTNYALQTANESVTRCPNVALRYFGRIPAKRLPTLLSIILRPTDWYPEILVAIASCK